MGTITSQKAAVAGKRNGNNLIEFTFLVPWFIFLFVGAFDMGIYYYSLIGVENAAHQAALVCSASTTTCTSGSDTTACGYALDQLRGLPNVGSAAAPPCSGSPVSVTVSYVTSPDGVTQGSAQVTVSYASPSLATIPGVLPGQYTATRTVSMRVRS